MPSSSVAIATRLPTELRPFGRAAASRAASARDWLAWTPVVTRSMNQVPIAPAIAPRIASPHQVVTGSLVVLTGRWSRGPRRDGPSAVAAEIAPPCQAVSTGFGFRRSERWPGNGRPVRSRLRKAARFQQAVDATAGRRDLGPRQEVREVAGEIPAQRSREPLEPGPLVGRE